MNFYELCQRLQEDGDLNSYAAGKDSSHKQQVIHRDDDLAYDKTENRKRRLKDLNFCKRQKK